ncbi:class I tRNA ligase family protein [Pseudonocardia sp. MCCB 268]|nr:class I tRNA ligase family protein [Pseudonocardia cytotoxica]
MSGSKFSTSRGTVIYVGDFCGSSGRTRCATTSPSPGGNRNVDFTWDEFVRRISFELANGWGSLVQPVHLDGAHKNVGAVPGEGPARADAELLTLRQRPGSTWSAGCFRRNRFKQASTEAMRVVTAANRYLSTRSRGSARTTRTAGTRSCTPRCGVVQDITCSPRSCALGAERCRRSTRRHRGVGGATGTHGGRRRPR